MSETPEYRLDTEPVENLQDITSPDETLHPLITGPVKGAVITAPSGRQYDLTTGIIEIHSEDHVFVVNEVVRLYQWAAAFDPGSFCEHPEHHRHTGVPVEVEGEIVNWICENCTHELVKNANGFWSVKERLWQP